MAKAEDRYREIEATASNKKTDELLSGAGGLLSVFLGGRKKSRSLARQVGGLSRSRSQTSQAAQRLESQKNRVDDAVGTIQELEADLADELVAITDAWEAKAAAVGIKQVGLEKSDVVVDEIVLAWLPVDR